MDHRAHHHHEIHAVHHVGWLRAAVLGANDGILSTASLIVGVASASPDPRPVLIAGAAALAAGALSMAAGEFVSVSSQADLEQADLRREAIELAEDPDSEHRELTHIYVRRGLDLALADQVATQLMAHDALGAHARDELGLSNETRARPIQAAAASAASFAAGAAVPLIVTALLPFRLVTPGVILVSMLLLGALGALGARTGRAPVLPAVVRVVLLGVAAMLLTIALGRLIGTSL